MTSLPAIVDPAENTHGTGGLPPAAERDRAVRMALLRRILLNHRPLPVLFIGLALLMSIVLGPSTSTPAPVIGVWLATTIAIWTEIAWYTRRFFRHGDHDDPTRVERRLAARYVIANICWTSALLIFWVPENAEQNFALLLIYIAHLSVATATSAFNWTVYLACTVPIVLAIASASFAAGTAAYIAIGLVTSCAYGYLVTVARQMIDQSAATLHLRFENAGLIRDLARAKADSDKALTTAEEANALLSVREKRFRALVDNAFDGIVITSADGVITFATDAVGRIFGTAAETLLGRKISDASVPRLKYDLGKVVEEICTTPAGQGHVSGWVQTPDGEERWVEATGRNLLHDSSVHGVVFNVRDATDRKRADDELTLHLHVLESLASGAPLQIVLDALIESAEEIFPHMRAAIFLADEAGEHLHIAAAPSMPESYRDEMDGITIDADPCSCATAAATGRSVLKQDVQSDPQRPERNEMMRNASIRACWSCPIIGRDGNVLGTLAMNYTEMHTPTNWERSFFRGVAQLGAVAIERRRAEKHLAEALKNAEIANHSKSQFLANMSHELRTPLNAIIGFSEIMNEGMFGDIGIPEYKTYVRDIHMSGRHLLSLINDILDISKIEAGQMELDESWIDLAELVEWSVELVHHKSESDGVALKVDLADNLPLVLADERAIKQILLNLISNATKFTEKGGTVTVGAHLAPDGGLLLSVADTGIGIARHMIQRVMEPFAQAEGPLARKFGGTGLGLPITNSLTAMHGGELSLESELGVGTTVTVYLPANRLRPQRAEGETGGEPAASAAGRAS